MADSLRADSEAASPFFGDYLILLDKRRVPEKQRRWDVRRIEAIIKAQDGCKIKTLSAQDVRRHLERRTGGTSAPHFSPLSPALSLGVTTM